ncbi:tetratricopeptide repeat protein [Persephonella sp.]
MEKIRKCLSGCLQIAVVLFLLSGCSFPKIIVYEDPLSPSEHNDLGVAYERKGKLQLAEKEYRKAIDKKPDWDIPYFNLGNIYFKMGKYSLAEKYYKKALEINHLNTDAMNNLAYLYMVQDRLSEAYRLIKKALTIKQKPEYIQTMKEIEEKINESG